MSQVVTLDSGTRIVIPDESLDDLTSVTVTDPSGGVSVMLLGTIVAMTNGEVLDLVEAAARNTLAAAAATCQLPGETSLVPQPPGTAPVPPGTQPGKKVVPATAYKKHADGTVVARHQDGTRRVAWDEERKAFLEERRTGPGEWKPYGTWPKGKLYEKLKSEVGWVQPAPGHVAVKTLAKTKVGVGAVSPVPLPPKPAVTLDAGGVPVLGPAQKVTIDAAFKQSGVFWYSDTTKIYDAAQAVVKKHPELSLKHVLDWADAHLTKKTDQPFTTKVEKWAKSAKGKAHITTAKVPTISSTITEALPAKAPSPGSAPAGRRASLSVDEARKMHGEMQATRVWVAAERSALRTYTGSAYKQMNDCLRFLRGCTERARQLIRNGVSGMRATTREFTVYRGSSLRSLTGGRTLDPRQLIGTTVSDRGFVSTSIGPYGTFGGDVRYEIEVPRGTRGAYVRDISRHSSEDEFIIAPDTRFKVLDARYVNKRWHVRMEAIP